MRKLSSSFVLPIIGWIAAAFAGPCHATSLEQIMADPDWIGAAVRDPYWAVDDRALYYSLKRNGAPVIDLHRVGLDSGGDKVIDGQDMAAADANAVWDAVGRHAAFVRNHDVFIRDLPGGRLHQVTRAGHAMGTPQFSADGRLLSFRVDDDWFVYDTVSGLSAPAALIKAEKDPAALPPMDDLREMQLRTFSTLRKLRDDAAQLKAHADEQRRRDPTQPSTPFYLGDEVTVRGTVMSPDAHWMVVVTEPKSYARGFEGKLTRYVTESGYEEMEKERLRVGRNPPPPQSLLLLNLADHSVHPLSMDGLPGIYDDPLASVRAENAAAPVPAPVPAPAPLHAPLHPPPKRRDVWVLNDDPDVDTGGIVWSGDSRQVALQLFSIDNKDRWIVRVDLGRYVLLPQQRLTDQAWINQSAFNELGWLKDNRSLWYMSEESGYAHLYTKSLDGTALSLTHGGFEVSEPALSADGRWFYVLSNQEAPYAYDVYRVPSSGGALQRITHLKGVERFGLDHRGKRLLLAYSSPYVRTQLAVTSADGTSEVRKLTDTRTSEYKAFSWIEPQIVQVPSSHFDGVIYAKVYGGGNFLKEHGGVALGGARPGGAAQPAIHPAVMFVHGAGYLQDVHLHFSYYFREQMFSNWLVQHGYVVMDMDYRASAGYGRDWRTAIYRQMGHPELDDLLDGKQWLVRHAAVDPKRVGIYGGSYGGFLTLMALFRTPGEFAAGAALRPVTDWMQYDHGYTSGILNDPQVDPIAYRRSSPIEFAQGLRDPLLICHGVIDDNVLFEDSMRLYERLIELHKEDFTLSPYPLDRHGFSNPDSWLDEYKRIFKLFEAHLQ